MFNNIEPSGLYYKHMTIINYTFSIINMLEALLTDDARVVIYDRHVFIVQATGLTQSDMAYFWNRFPMFMCSEK